jgi:hypothetical protein
MSMSNADIVNSWFAARISSGAVGRNTEAYNQVVEALPDLIASLDGAAAPVTPASAATSATTAQTDSASTVSPDPAAGSKS